jgi:hypothetical protein
LPNSNVEQLITHFVCCYGLQQVTQPVYDLVGPLAKRSYYASVSMACGHILEMQFLEVPAIMRNYAHASCHSIVKLFCI